MIELSPSAIQTQSGKRLCKRQAIVVPGKDEPAPAEATEASVISLEFELLPFVTFYHFYPHNYTALAYRYLTMD